MNLECHSHSNHYSLHVCLCTTLMPGTPRSPKKALDPLVTDSSELPCGFWEWPHLLKEQLVFLTEPSLAPGTIFLRCKCKANRSNLSVIQNSTTRWEVQTGKTPKACGQDSLVYSQRENLAQTWWRKKAELEIVFDFHTCTEAGLCSPYIHILCTHTCLGI